MRDQSCHRGWVVIRDHRGCLLGMCGQHARLGAHRLEIGYWVHVRHTRRGVATLALAALTELALTIPELTAVEIYHHRQPRQRGRPRQTGL